MKMRAGAHWLDGEKGTFVVFLAEVQIAMIFFPFLYFLLEKFTCHMGASELVTSKDYWPEELTPAQVLFER